MIQRCRSIISCTILPLILLHALNNHNDDVFIAAFTLTTATTPHIAALSPLLTIGLSSDSNSDNDGNGIDVDVDESQFYSPNNVQTIISKRNAAAVAAAADYATTSNDGTDSENSNFNEVDPTASTSVNEYSFFDEATIFIRAGSGGQGSSTYRKGPNGQNAQPDGGDGGKGGDVIIAVEDSLNTLAGLTNAWRPNSFGGGGAAATAGGYRPMSFRAENGNDGDRQYKNGRFGKDVVIKVPPGTIIEEEIDEVEIDPETGKRTVLSTSTVGLGSVGLLDPSDPDAYDKETGLPNNWRRLVVGQGGEGGEGSGSQGFKKGRGVKRTRASPIGGARKRLKLTLKIVADVALVGVPNAGKSTFLAAVTRAKPKIANYPFTTVVPNLGVWVPPNEYGSDNNNGKKSKITGGAGSEGLALCDVPGLIAGAAEGIGLGHAFLRHVERCHVILHLVDATSKDPVSDFHMVNKEIIGYGNGKLAQMPQIVVVNKVDAWEEGSGEEWEKGLKTRLDREDLEGKLKEAMTHSRLMWMSAKERDGVDDLMGRMAGFVKKVKSAST